KLPLEKLLKKLSKLDIEASSALMVGDSMFDLNAGLAAGVPTCIVTYGFGSEEELRAQNPDFIINDFHELKVLL
ncbi:MAG: HAD hydrolase-like protein, partial [Thermoplasmata archaeon]